MTKLNLDEVAFHFYLYDRVVQDVLPAYGAEFLFDWSTAYKLEWNKLDDKNKQLYFVKAEKYMDTFRNA